MAKQLPVVAAGLVLTVDMRNCKIDGWVWPQSARRQERAGKLQAIRDSEGEIVAWQRVMQPVMMLREEMPTSDGRFATPVLDRSQASISVSEMHAYAGRGKSRTAGMSEEQRKAQRYSEKPLTAEQIAAGKRSKFGTPPVEDFIERLEAKVSAFGEVRPARTFCAGAV